LDSSSIFSTKKHPSPIVNNLRATWQAIDTMEFCLKSKLTPPDNNRHSVQQHFHITGLLVHCQHFFFLFVHF
jgi:hypothetical protein